MSIYREPAPMEQIIFSARNDLQVEILYVSLENIFLIVDERSEPLLCGPIIVNGNHWIALKNNQSHVREYF